MIAFIFTFTLTGEDQRFKQLLAVHERYLRSQPGFGGFELRRSSEDPVEYQSIIEWEDQASHSRLMDTEEFAEQINKIQTVATVACSPVSASATIPAEEGSESPR